MRTNIDIDDKLMAKAMKASKLEVKTKKAVVEEALDALVKSRAQEGIWKYFGKVQWDDPAAGLPEKDKWAEGDQRYRESFAKKASKPSRRRVA